MNRRGAEQINKAEVRRERRFAGRLVQEEQQNSRLREKKEQERKRQLKLQKKRRAKIRRRVLLCTTALLGVALFLAVRLMKNWNVQPEEKEEKAELTLLLKLKQM